jgi:hypothetical protein
MATKRLQLKLKNSKKICVQTKRHGERKQNKDIRASHRDGYDAGNGEMGCRRVSVGQWTDLVSAQRGIEEE